MVQFNPLAYQPLSIFFDFQINGLENIFKNPNIPVDFNLTYQEAGPTTGSHKCSLTLLDQTGYQVEPYLWYAKNNSPQKLIGAQVFWGYQNIPGQTVQATMPIAFFDYKPVFVDNKWLMHLQGTTLPAAQATFSCNNFNGTINDIFSQFCEKYGLDGPEIDPPFGITQMMSSGYTGVNTTAQEARKFIKLLNESDWAFLLRVIGHARDGNGRGGYKIHLIQQASGKTLMRVSLPNQPQDDVFTFTIQEKNSVVKAWGYDFDFTAGLLMANNISMNGWDRHTGDPIKFVFQRHLTDPFQSMPTTGAKVNPHQVPVNKPASNIVFRNPERMELDVVNGHVRSRPMPTTDGNQGLNEALNQHLYAIMMAQAAQIVVLGDPNLTSGANCQINFNYPETLGGSLIAGYQHYASGLYRVKSCQHIIRAGEYLCVLDLQRPAALNAPKLQ